MEKSDSKATKANQPYSADKAWSKIAGQVLTMEYMEGIIRAQINRAETPPKRGPSDHTVVKAVRKALKSWTDYKNSEATKSKDHVRWQDRDSAAALTPIPPYHVFWAAVGVEKCYDANDCFNVAVALQLQWYYEPKKYNQINDFWKDYNPDHPGIAKQALSFKTGIPANIRQSFDGFSYPKDAAGMEYKPFEGRVIANFTPANKPKKSGSMPKTASKKPTIKDTSDKKTTDKKMSDEKPEKKPDMKHEKKHENKPEKKHVIIDVGNSDDDNDDVSSKLAGVATSGPARKKIKTQYPDDSDYWIMRPGPRNDDYPWPTAAQLQDNSDEFPWPMPAQPRVDAKTTATNQNISYSVTKFEIHLLALARNPVFVRALTQNHQFVQDLTENDKFIQALGANPAFTQMIGQIQTQQPQDLSLNTLSSNIGLQSSQGAEAQPKDVATTTCKWLDAYKDRPSEFLVRLIYLAHDPMFVHSLTTNEEFVQGVARSDEFIQALGANPAFTQMIGQIRNQQPQGSSLTAPSVSVGPQPPQGAESSNNSDEK